jgi:hypothetical protein
MINPAKPEIKAAKPRTYTTLWDTIRRARWSRPSGARQIFTMLTLKRSKCALTFPCTQSVMPYQVTS